MSKEYQIVIAHYQTDVVSGAENSIADLVDRMDKRFQITMLIPRVGNLSRFFEKRGFRVWIKGVETPRRLFPGLHHYQSYMLAEEMKKRHIDALLCNTFPAASRVSTACQTVRLPYAIYMRDYTPNIPIHCRILNKADLLFAISKDVIRYHSEMVDPGHFRLTYNYINPEPILSRHKAHQASGKRLLPFDPQHPVVGLVGRITPYKQPDLFIRAIPHVLEQCPSTRFVLIGSAQEREKAYEEMVKSLISELGIEGKVAFLGQRHDAIELTSELHIACLTSTREPLGRVILEAGLLGVPVVVPNTGGPAEVVHAGTSGLEFPSTVKDADVQLAQRIIRLLKDPELHARLAEEARKRIMATFASQKPVEIQEEYIEQLCAANPYA